MAIFRCIQVDLWIDTLSIDYGEEREREEEVEERERKRDL